MKEEDTVAVDQELVRLELGGAPEAKEQAPGKPKEPAAEKPSEPVPEKSKEKEPSSGQGKPQEPASAPSQPSSQPEAPKQKSEPSSKPQPTSGTKESMGNREERRVRAYFNANGGCHDVNSLLTGQNESYAAEDCRAVEAVSKHSCLSHYVQ